MAMTDCPQSPATEADSAGVTAEGLAYKSDPQRLQYVGIAAPAPGQAVAVAQGVWWGRIPLPLELNHINVWLLETANGYVVVDTGMAVDIGKEAWQQIEAQLCPRMPLCAVLVTHIHPDHLGLAAWLQQRHDIPVLMSRRTHEQAVELLSDTGGATSEEVAAFLHRHGVAETQGGRGLFAPHRFARMVSGLPSVSRYLGDSDTLPWNADTWTALQTDGHAEGHLCLSNCAHRLLISGDQVLPTISPNIGLGWRNQDLNPLGSYLSSLERLRRLDRDTLVLPSHGHPFYGLRDRIDDLREHHLRQLESLVAACQTPQSAVDILPVMFRRVLKGMHFLLALAEALAHLEYLVHAARLRHIVEGGVVRYVA
jgi:glyoxylase-like metal-dependent hydrolase (beta-lactamase superfamily II)